MDLEELKTRFDVSEVVGKPIVINKFTTIVPISKVSYGCVGGDAEVKKESGFNADGFGMTVTPLGILLCGEKNSYIKIDESYSEEKWISLAKSIVNTFQK